MTVVIRPSTGGSIVSKLIRIDTWSCWSHVDTVIPAGHPMFPDCPDGGLLGAQKDGVKVRPWNYDPKSKFEYLQTKSMSALQESLYYAYLKSQLGKPYDTKWIFGYALHRDWRNPDSWGCSDLVMAAFEMSGYYILRPEALDRTSPRDIVISPLLMTCAATASGRPLNFSRYGQ
jgi:uncharacterized protein YycO